MYQVGVTVSTPTSGNPATLENAEELGDYSLGDPGVSYRQLPFPSNMQEIPFIFLLFEDDTFECTEGFRAIILTVAGTPTFQDPTTAALTTIIKIVDDDCKLNCNVCACDRIPSLHSCQGWI